MESCRAVVAIAGDAPGCPKGCGGGTVGRRAVDGADDVVELELDGCDSGGCALQVAGLIPAHSQARMRTIGHADRCIERTFSIRVSGRKSQFGRSESRRTFVAGTIYPTSRARSRAACPRFGGEVLPDHAACVWGVTPVYSPSATVPGASLAHLPCAPPIAGVTSALFGVTIAKALETLLPYIGLEGYSGL
jgi:hypothetical protein